MGDIDKFITNTGEKAKYLFKKVTGFLSMGASFVFLCFSVLFISLIFFTSSSASFIFVSSCPLTPLYSDFKFF